MIWSWYLEDARYTLKDAEPKDRAEALSDLKKMMNDPIPGITKESKMAQAERDSFAAFSAAMGGSKP